MRKFIFITAMVLASATAHAGETRSLSLASNEPPAVAEQPKTLDQKPLEQKTVEQKIVEQQPVEQKAVEQQPAEVPKAVPAPVAAEAPAYVARPAAVGTVTAAPKAEMTSPVAGKTSKTASLEKPKRRRQTTEARVIRELHRHGIYW